MAKNFNPNLAKINRSYTVEEVANLYSVHKNTVRNWINAQGLKTNDSLRPILILVVIYENSCKLKEQRINVNVYPMKFIV